MTLRKICRPRIYCIYYCKLTLIFYIIKISEKEIYILKILIHLMSKEIAIYNNNKIISKVCNCENNCMKTLLKINIPYSYFFYTALLSYITKTRR